MFGIFACTSGSRPKSPTDSSVEKSIADDDSTGCNFPAKDVMPGINIYQNPETTGDKVDPKLADQNFQQLKPMYNFILAVGRAVEGIPTWKGVPVIDKECVRSTFESWAEKSALLTRPPLSGGLVNRVMYTVALNVAALKARKAGVTFSANVEKWLFTLTSAVMQDYGLKGYHHHGFHNNVNAWSGAAAATFLAYTESPKNANYQVMMKEEQELFLETLRGINQKNPYKGLIPSELKRGQNAFAYSLFYMSALSMQLRARRAIG